ncbi:MAG: translocation/assembly module TamB [Rhizobiaceae bacterium]|nr:MAG: translocation/assembly module TamB [Rhizobiaceae bacterium]
MAAVLRRIFRILRLLVVLVLALAIGAILVFTLTEKGRENLAGLVSDLASTEASKVRIGRLDGIWSGHLTLGHLVLEDAEGPWLAARDVAIDWSPLALLSSTFDADRVSAARIEVARLPESRGGEGGGLPVDIAVRALDLPDIALGEELAGGIARLSASGALVAKAEPLDVDLDLSVKRTDGRDGAVEAKIRFAPSEDVLDVAVEGLEPAGGIVANLLRLPGAPAVAFSLTGKGPADDWKGEGSFSADGQVVTTLKGGYRRAGDARRVAVEGKGSFERFVPEVLRPLLAGDTAFDVAVALGAAGGIEVERATLASAAATAQASGSIDPSRGSDFSLDLAARGAPVRLTFGKGAGAVSVSVERATARAFGDGSAPMVDVTASLPEVSAAGNVVTAVEAALHSDGFAVATQTGPVEVSLKAQAVSPAEAALRPFLAGPVSATAVGAVGPDAIAIDKSSVSGAALRADLSGAVSRSDGSLRLAVEADVAASALPGTAQRIAGERVALTATVARDAAGALAVSPLSLNSGPLTAEGSVELSGETLSASLRGALADVGRLAEGAVGAVTFSVEAKGRPSAPEVSLAVSADRVEAAGRAITGLALTASGAVDPANPAASVALKGDIAGSALAGSAELKTTDGRRAVDGLVLSLGDNRIAGSLVLDDAFVPEGTIDFTLPDLGPLAALAFETVEGKAEGTIRFSRQDGVPELAVRATTAAFVRGDVSARDLAVEGTVFDWLGDPVVSGRVVAALVKAGGASISGVDVKLTRAGEWTGFNGGATVNDMPARAAGRLKVDGGRTTVELSSASATVSRIAASLARPGVVVVENGSALLDGLALSVGGGSVVVSGTAGSDLALEVRFSGLPASTANAFSAGLGASGTISGTARVTGKAARPTVGYQIDWTGAQTAQTRDAGFAAMSIRSTGTYAGDSLEFTANVGDGSGLGMQGGGKVRLGGPASLDLAFSGKVPFSFLTRRLAAQGLALTGGAEVSLTVTGAALAPTVAGSVRASGARFVDSRSGIAITDLAADIGIGGGTATVRSLKGNLSSGGSVSASGTVGIDAGSGFPANLTLRIVDGRYTDGRIVTATLGGELTLKGPLVSAPALAGTVNLGRTVITIPERLPGSLATLDVQHKNASQAVVSQQEAIKPAEAGGGGGGLLLDVTVNAPQQIFVQGRGLDTELGGSLRLTGSSAAPQAVGQFTMRRGRLSLLGRRLNFTSGTLGFSGSLLPYLDLAAETTTSDATVSILVTGPATDPKFSFSSTPSLPEDEVLARLVFGRSMSNLSPLQIAQLAEAAAQIAGVGGPTSLLESLRSQTGIDDLDVKTDAEGNAAVSAGKYLNDRTYVTIEKGEKAGSGKATIDLDVGRGVKLRGEAGEDGKAKGGIFFEKEY